MAAHGAVGDAPKVRGGSRPGNSLWGTTSALSGTNGVKAIVTPFSVIDAVSIQQKEDVASSGDGVSKFTYTVSGSTVTVQGWVAGAADPTLSKATTEATPFSIMVLGR